MAYAATRTVPGTSDTPTTSDDGGLIQYTSASAKTITLTGTSWIAGRSAFAARISGGGTATFTAGSGVTVNGDTTIASGQTVVCQYTGSNTWEIVGTDVLPVASGGTGATTAAGARAALEAARATVLDIRDFGAVGNGSTDSTTAIQNAIDEAHSRLGAVVLVPEGDFVADQLTMRDHVILRGLGWGGTAPLGTVPTLGTSVLRQGSGVNDDFIVWEETDYGVDYAGASALQHLIIIGDASSTGGHAIHLKDGSLNLRLQDGVEIEKLFIRGFYGDAFRAYGCTPGFINGLRVLSVGGYAINLIEDGANAGGDVHHLVVRDLSADACDGGAAIRIEGAPPMGSHTFIGIKSEQADLTVDGDGTSGYGSEHVFEFHNCRHRVAIHGVTHKSAGATVFRPDSIIVCSGTYRPEISWSGVNVRLLSSQSTGDLPHLIDDQVEGITVPMSRGAQGTLHRGQRTVGKITGRPPAVRFVDGEATTQNAAALQITGDIDIRARILPVAKTDGQPHAIVTKRSGATGEFSFRMNTDRTLTLARYGAAADFRNSTVALPASNDPFWVRVTHDVSVAGGASPREVKFFTSTDGVTWTQLGSTVTQPGTFTATATTNPVIVGDEDNLRDFYGRVYEVEVRDGIDGTIVLRFDADDVPECPWGQQTWVGSVDGRTYTATGTAEPEPSSFLPVSAGGTGADTPAGARANLFPSPATYTASNVTTDRAFDANATTLDELADVVGTLIADLKTYGLLQ